MKKIFTLFYCWSLCVAIWSQIPTSGLVAWYPFNNNLLDSTSNNQDLVAVNNNGGLNYVPGQNGSALNFAEAGNCDIPVNLNFTGLNNHSFTAAGWFNLSDSTHISPVTLCVGRDAVSNTATFALEYYNGGGGGSVAFYTYYNLSYTSLDVSQVPLTDEYNEWHHFAFSYEGGDSLKAYLDGVFLPSFSLPAASDTLNNITTSLEFGASLTYCNVQGSTDDFMMYNRALSNAEVTQLYNSNPLGINTESSETIRVYPNPASDLVHIHVLNNEKIESVELLTMEGEIITVQSPFKNTISIEDLSPGVYYIRCKSQQSQFVQKLIKN